MYAWLSRPSCRNAKWGVAQGVRLAMTSMARIINGKMRRVSSAKVIIASAGTRMSKGS